jgi:hypothetical protein
MGRWERIAFFAGMVMVFAGMALVDRIGLVGLLVLGGVGIVLTLFASFPDFERKRAERGTRYVVEVFALWALVFATVIALWVTGRTAIGFAGMGAILIYALVMKRGRPQ